jgi:hypothetical protein
VKSALRTNELPSFAFVRSAPRVYYGKVRRLRVRLVTRRLLLVGPGEHGFANVGRGEDRPVQ